MRTKDVLIDGFEDIKILQQYLYMNEEHTITIKNRMNTNLRIHMNEHGCYLCENLVFPHLTPTNQTEHMTIPTMLSIIQQLKEQPAEQFPKIFENRWEEIQEICRTNLAINVFNRN